MSVVNPEKARPALHAGLVVRRAHPLNCETPLSALTGGVVMPSARFYIRSYFGIPHLDPAGWRLHVDGLVKRRLSLDLDQLQAMPSASAVVTLECAGNGRGGLEPPVPGEQWDLGAVSTAEWTGVPLTEVLDRPHHDPSPGHRPGWANLAGPAAMEPARLRQQRHPPGTPSGRRVTQSAAEPVVPPGRSPADAGLAGREEPESAHTQHSSCRRVL